MGNGLKERVMFVDTSSSCLFSVKVNRSNCSVCGYGFYNSIVMVWDSRCELSKYLSEGWLLSGTGIDLALIVLNIYNNGVGGILHQFCVFILLGPELCGPYQIL